MEIRHEETGHRGAFFTERDGKRLGQMTYTTAGATRIIIDHTEVSDELRGTGTGAKLGAAAVEWARAANRKVIPLCPYAKSVFDKTPAYQDVLAK